MDIIIVTIYQKIDFLLKTILNFSLLAKNCFCLIVTFVDKINEIVNISID